jgi:hypothetical protein
VVGWALNVYLNAGFGEPLSAEDHDLIRSWGFDGIRQDVKDSGAIPALVENSRLQKRCIFVVDIGQAAFLAALVAQEIIKYGLEDASAIEIGNEVDATPMRPEEFGLTVCRAYEAVRTLGPVNLISGGVTNTTVKAFNWLGEALEVIPEEVGIGYHAYRNGTPFQAHDGFKARRDEFKRLREIAGDREIWHTEGGWHTAEKTKPFPMCFQKERLTSQEVGNRLVAELRLNEQAGARSFTVYQLNDGPTDTPIDRYGLRTQSGQVKPSALMLADALAGRH